MQKNCHIYKQKFYDKDKKYSNARDHCHYTGEYRGAAQRICSLTCRFSKWI